MVGCSQPLAADSGCKAGFAAMSMLSRVEFDALKDMRERLPVGIMSSLHLCAFMCVCVCVLYAVCCVLCKRVADRPWLKLQGYFCLYGKFSLLLLLLLFVPQLCCSISTQRTQHTQTGSTNPCLPPCGAGAANYS